MTGYAIFTDDHGHHDRLEYTTLAEDEHEALEKFAEDIMSDDRSVEKGWVWHVFEIPTDLVDADLDAADVYDYCEGERGIKLKTPMPA